MSLPPEAQTLVSQLVTVLGLQRFGAMHIEINIDRDRLVQDIKPTPIFRREKDKAA